VILIEYVPPFSAEFRHLHLSCCGRS